MTYFGHKNSFTKEDVLQHLEAWYWRNGRFPNEEDVISDRTLPCYSTIANRVQLRDAKRIIQKRIREAYQDASNQK